MMFWLGVGMVFLVTLAAAGAFAVFAPRVNLVAHPGGHRQHQAPTPMVGGLAMFVGLLAGAVLMDSSFVRLLPSLLLLCFVGVIDDRFSLPSWVRFLAQAVAAYLMIEFTGVQLISLGNLMSENNDVLLGRLATPLTIFATIGVINAVNMSDGLDGLAGGLVAVVLASLLYFDAAATDLIVITLASVAGFMVLNVRLFRPHAKIFMGDAGSTVLGIILAYLLISSSQTPGGIKPVTALWLLTLPLIDAVAVLVVRPLRGRSPFAADRIHYHHLLADQGLRVNGVLAAALVIQLCFIVFGAYLVRMQVADHIQLAGFLMLFIVYLFVLLRFTRDSSRP